MDYFTKKLFGVSSETKAVEVPGQRTRFAEAEMELSKVKSGSEELIGKTCVLIKVRRSDYYSLTVCFFACIMGIKQLEFAEEK